MSNSLGHRIVKLERELAQLRRRNAAFGLVCAIVAIGFACKDKAPTPTQPPEPPTSVQFGDVVLDKMGLRMGDPKKGPSTSISPGHISVTTQDGSKPDALVLITPAGIGLQSYDRTWSTDVSSGQIRLHREQNNKTLEADGK